MKIEYQVHIGNPKDLDCIKKILFNFLFIELFKT